MYSLDGLETALALRLGGKDPAAVGAALPNLLPTSKAAAASGGQVTLLTYLRDLYPNDWRHFMERVERLAKALCTDTKGRESAVAERISERFKDGFESMTEWDFSSGNALAPWAMELQLWASYRSQVR